MSVLISSHELGEIDGVATHVAFLDEGKLLFEESMSDLTGRFREVHITMERDALPPSSVPAHRLDVRASGNVLMFVDARFTGDDLSARLNGLVSGVRHIDAQPMALRSIFTTLARASTSPRSYWRSEACSAPDSAGVLGDRRARPCLGAGHVHALASCVCGPTMARRRTRSRQVHDGEFQSQQSGREGWRPSPVPAVTTPL
jgi:hypothetical protein